MPKIAYEFKNFHPKTLAMIAKANEIIDSYAAQGFQLSLRQLYYQFVARGLIANKQTEYSRLGNVISDARLAGLVDWNAIEDRTRDLEITAHWDDPQDIMEIVSRQFRIDKWKSQPTRVEVWIEKDALTGVIDPVCRELDIGYFSCRGYTSQSEMWKAGAVRFRNWAASGQDIVLLHFGDHDPSGMDMSRDIESRIRMFMDAYQRRLTFKRLALNDDQIAQYNPPPNPVKFSDSRATDYEEKYGDTCWELDALEPTVIADLVRSNVEEIRDEENWDESVEEESEHRTALATASKHWNEVAAYVKQEFDEETPDE